MRKAQSTLEYIIVFSAIVGAILVVASGPLHTGVTNVYNSAEREISESAVNFTLD